MLTARWVSAFLVLGLLLAMPSFAETPVQSMISKGDHEALADYYAQQAQELKDKAKHWEFTAEFYEKHADAKTKADSDQHAAHCRAIAKSYQKAAEEAQVLSREHRALKPRSGAGP